MFKDAIKTQNGLAALLSVVIIGAVSLIIVKNVSWIGLGEIDIAYTAVRSDQALALAEGCVEEALRRLQINPDYETSNADFTLKNGTCSVKVSANGNEREVIALGIAKDCYKKIKVNANINNNSVSISNWQEISD